MTYDRKIVRSVVRDLSFYVTGSLLTAITVMLLIGAFAVSDTIRQRFTDYFEATNVEDGEFTTLREIPEEAMAALEAEYGAALERQQYVDATYGDTRVRLFEETERIDLYTLTEGEKAGKNGEMVLTYNYAKANHVQIGDEMELAGKTFRVTGYGMKPDYAIMLYALTETIADKKGFGIGIISKEDMEGLQAPHVFYSVKYQEPEREKEFRRAVNEAYGIMEYIEKSANSRISLIFTEAEDLRAEFSLYCPVLMVVVVAVIAMVLAKKVKRESKNVGTLMALGYRKGELVRHYLIYGMIPAVFGDLLGLLLSIPFSKVFCEFFFADAEYLEYQVQYPVRLTAVALLVPVVVYALVSFVVLQLTLQSDVVPLLKGLKKSRVVRVPGGKEASLSLIYNLRCVLSNGLRSLTLVTGMAVATLVILLGASYEDAYQNLIREKVPMAMLGGKYEYGFREFQKENPYGGEAIFDVSFGVPEKDDRFNLIGVNPVLSEIELRETAGREVDLKKYYATTSMAARYGLRPGDDFTFYNTASMAETTVVIEGLIQNDVLSLLITGKENVAELIGHPAEEYNVIISLEKLEIPGEMLLKEASLKDYQTQAENLTSTAGIVLKLLKVLGVLICILVVNMMSGMLMEESSRNISMLEVLGYREGEVKRFVLTANHLLVPVGFLIGVPLGYLTAYSMMLPSAQYSGMLMSLPVKPATILGGLMFILCAYAIAIILAGRKVKKINVTESLKCPLE